MSIVIHTQDGTYIVPSENESALVAWLQQNAVRAGQKSVRENQTDDVSGIRQLISEDFGREF